MQWQADKSQISRYQNSTKALQCQLAQGMLLILLRYVLFRYLPNSWSFNDFYSVNLQNLALTIHRK